MKEGKKHRIFFNIPKCHVTPTAEESSVDKSSITNWRSMEVESVNFLKNCRISYILNQTMFREGKRYINETEGCFYHIFFFI